MYYHRTSGTVGAPKNIPVTASGLAQMKRDQRLSAYVWARHSGVLERKVLGIGGAAVEGRMAGGTPFGSASGVLYRSQSRFVRSRYVLPPEVSEIEDYGAALPHDGNLWPFRGRRDGHRYGEPVDVPAAAGRWCTTTPTPCSTLYRDGAAAGAGRGARAGGEARAGAGAVAASGVDGAAHVRGHLARPAGHRNVDGRELRHRAGQPGAAAAGGRAHHRVGVLVERVSWDAQCGHSPEPRAFRRF